MAVNPGTRFEVLHDVRPDPISSSPQPSSLLQAPSQSPPFNNPLINLYP
jgi:hypothetical protein